MRYWDLKFCSVLGSWLDIYTKKNTTSSEEPPTAGSAAFPLYCEDDLVGALGLEPKAYRLKAECSTIELYPRLEFIYDEKIGGADWVRTNRCPYVAHPI